MPGAADFLPVRDGEGAGERVHVHHGLGLMGRVHVHFDIQFYAQLAPQLSPLLAGQHRHEGHVLRERLDLRQGTRGQGFMNGIKHCHLRGGIHRQSFCFSAASSTFLYGMAMPSVILPPIFF